VYDAPRSWAEVLSDVPAEATMRFRIDGEDFDKEPEDVEAAMRGVRPERIQQLAGKVGGVWFPVRQVVGVLVGRRPQDLNSGASMRILRRLGFEVHDIRRDGPLPDVSSVERQPSQTRLEVLKLAVELVRGSPNPTPERVIEVADRFEKWVA
jgi:hypothetical protein